MPKYIYTMRRPMFVMLILATFAMLALKPKNDPLPIGAALPNAEVKMKDINGTEVSFKEVQKMNGLLVMFSCNTCPIVKKYQTRTLEVAKQAIANEVGVILLNSNEATRNDGDSYEDMKEYAKQQGYYFNYTIDNNSAMANAFGANRTPEIFLFNKEGKLVYHGAIDDNSGSPDEVTRKHAIAAIVELAAGKDISVKETRSVGCAIKRKS